MRNKDRINPCLNLERYGRSHFPIGVLVNYAVIFSDGWLLKRK